MIRHRCAACGHPINRTDHFFEPSDGTLCAACLARLAPAKWTGKAADKRAATLGIAPPPAWARLPELGLHGRGQG